MSHSGISTGYGPAPPVRTKIAEILPLKMEGNYYLTPISEADLKNDQFNTRQTVVVDKDPNLVATELTKQGYQVKVQDTPPSAPIVSGSGRRPQGKSKFGSGWFSGIFSAFN